MPFNPKRRIPRPPSRTDRPDHSPAWVETALCIAIGVLGFLFLVAGWIGSLLHPASAVAGL